MSDFITSVVCSAYGPYAPACKQVVNDVKEGIKSAWEKVSLTGNSEGPGAGCAPQPEDIPPPREDGGYVVPPVPNNPWVGDAGEVTDGQEPLPDTWMIKPDNGTLPLPSQVVVTDITGDRFQGNTFALQPVAPFDLDSSAKAATFCFETVPESGVPQTLAPYANLFANQGWDGLINYNPVPKSNIPGKAFKVYDNGGTDYYYIKDPSQEANRIPVYMSIIDITVIDENGVKTKLPSDTVCSALPCTNTRLGAAPFSGTNQRYCYTLTKDALGKLGGKIQPFPTVMINSSNMDPGIEKQKLYGTAIKTTFTHEYQ